MSLTTTADQAGAASWSALVGSLNPHRDELRMLLYELVEASHPDHHALVRDRLLELHEVLDRRQVTVVFGGHFSCGKSTLLNALLSRDLLPAGDYPETGVACRIRPGARDDVVAVGDDGGVRLPVCTAAIARYISLIGADGAYRQQVAGVRRLDITLAGTGLRPGVMWIDSPGIDDKPEATERARAAAAAADVLVWVFDSRQPLSETDVRFIDEHADTHGQDSILFVLNAFLPADTEEDWDRFLARNLPQVVDKLEGRLGDVAVVSTSARAISRHPGHFGGPRIRRLLYDVADANHPLVAASRLTRALHGLAELAAIVDGWVAAEEQARAAEVAAEDERFRAFARSVKRRIKAAFPEYVRAAQAVLAPVLASIDVAVQRDGAYARTISTEFARITTELGDVLISTVEGSATADGRPGLSGKAQKRLRKALAPGPVTIVVPDNAIGAQNPGAGAAAGALVGLALGPLGALVGAGIGGLIGTGRGAAVAIAQDQAEAKANVTAAHTRAMADLRAAQAVVLGLVTAEFTPVRDPAPPRTACRAVSEWLVERQESIRQALKDG